MTDISLLDYAMIDEGETPEEALAYTVDLAKHAEQWGYKRFWIAEHHNVPAFASSNPEIIMTKIASETSTLRVGSGGVMLPHYSPYNVAEEFRLMSGFFPGRIDLGIGNNPGTRPVMHAMETETDDAKNHHERVRKLRDNLATGKEGRLAVNPMVETTPEMWQLSTSVNSAKQCAELGLSYCYGLFPYARQDAVEVGQKAIKTYRENFQPSGIQSEPHTMAGIFISSSTDPNEVDDVAKTIDVWLLGRKQFTQFRQFPSIETARVDQITDEEQQAIKDNRTRMAHGTIDEVVEQLKAIQKELDADEWLLMPLIPGHERRLKVIEALSKAFDLKQTH